MLTATSTIISIIVVPTLIHHCVCFLIIILILIIIMYVCVLSSLMMIIMMIKSSYQHSYLKSSSQDKFSIHINTNTLLTIVCWFCCGYGCDIATSAYSYISFCDWLSLTAKFRCHRPISRKNLLFSVAALALTLSCSLPPLLLLSISVYL